MKWYNLEKDGEPGSEENSWEGSDEHYMVVLENKWITVSFFFCDSFGNWWSTQWEPYDKYYTGKVTHWAKMPKLPK